jgi:hypothetical protein
VVPDDRIREHAHIQRPTRQRSRTGPGSGISHIARWHQVLGALLVLQLFQPRFVNLDRSARFRIVAAFGRRLIVERQIVRWRDFEHVAAVIMATLVERVRLPLRNRCFQVEQAIGSARNSAALDGDSDRFRVAPQNMRQFSDS